MRWWTGRGKRAMFSASIGGVGPPPPSLLPPLGPVDPGRKW